MLANNSIVIRIMHIVSKYPFGFKTVQLPFVPQVTLLQQFHCLPNAPYHKDNTDCSLSLNRLCALSQQRLQPPTPNSLDNCFLSDDCYTMVHCYQIIPPIKILVKASFGSRSIWCLYHLIQSVIQSGISKCLCIFLLLLLFHSRVSA